MSRGELTIINIITQSLGENGSDFSTFLSNIGYNDQNKITLWKDLIKRIQEQQGENGKVDGTNHQYPIRDIDWPYDQVNDDPLIQIIAEACNLKKETNEHDITLSEFYKLLRGEEGEEQKNFWNESVQELVEKIKEASGEEDPIIISIDENNKIKVSDFKKADAGNNYEFKDNDCVLPFKNISGKTYNEVRGTDQVEDIIKDLDKTDYTSSHLSDWFTLLMPQYSKLTQIEDLNRNFWVISEAINGLMEWTYKNSPTSQIINNLLNEITQLWQNLLYLWLEVAITNQKKSEANQILVEPVRLYRSEILTKYDNIPEINCTVENNTFNLSYNYSIIDNNIYFKHFQKEYSNSIVGILPIYRVNNYRKNYYSGEWYHKFLIWDNNIPTDEDNNEVKFWDFQIVESYIDGSNKKTRPLVISPRYEINKRFSSKIFATNLNGIQYYYTFPFSEVSGKTCEDGKVLLYGSLFIKPQIKFTKQIDGSINFSEFSLKVYDAAAPIGNSQLADYRLIGTFELEDANKNYGETDTNRVISLVYVENNFNQQSMNNVEKRNCDNISKSYYLGEVASWRGRAASS